MVIVCKKCKKPFDEEEFTVRGNGKRYDWCKACKKEYNTEYYAKNKDRHCEYVGTRKKRKVHICKHCGRGEPEVTFYRRRESTRGTPRFICRECDVLYRKRFPKYTEEARKGRNKRRIAKESRQRKSVAFSARYIFSDSKQADRKAGRVNDLTLAFIEAFIANGCQYCGATDLRMSLDRIDNTLGHTQANVNASCRRCNWLRRDMPFEAWIRMVPVIREIANEGLFGDWRAGPNKHPQVKESEKQRRFGVVLELDAET